MLIYAAQEPPERPGLYLFSTCRHTIRTVPVLPRDTRNPDDADTEAEDHIGDALRYRLLHKRATIIMRHLKGL